MKEIMQVRISLMTRLMFYFLLLIIIPLMVLGLYSYNITEQALKTEAENTLKITLNSTVEKLEDQMLKIEEFVNFFTNRNSSLQYANELQKGKIHPDTYNTIKYSLTGFIRDVKIAEQIFIVDKTVLTVPQWPMSLALARANVLTLRLVATPNNALLCAGCEHSTSLLSIFHLARLFRFLPSCFFLRCSDVLP